MTSTFDAYAATYDDVAESALGQTLRGRVHRVLADRVRPADRVLDIGCGTGIDAAWLAARGASVAGIDESSEMIDVARRRCRDLANVELRTANINDRGSLDFIETGSANVVLANFGVVNCVPDLPGLARQLQRILVPAGIAVLVPMGRRCPIELLVAVAGGNRRLLQRRSKGSLQYPSVDDLSSQLSPHLVLDHAEALGSVLPPFEQRSWVEHRPRLLAALARCDASIGKTAAHFDLGDHVITVFRAQP